MLDNVDQAPVDGFTMRDIEGQKLGLIVFNIHDRMHGGAMREGKQKRGGSKHDQYVLYETDKKINKNHFLKKDCFGKKMKFSAHSFFTTPYKI